jgi:hypothetical protein
VLKNLAQSCAIAAAGLIWVLLLLHDPFPAPTGSLLGYMIAKTYNW